MQDAPCTYRLSVKAIIKNVNEEILLIFEVGEGWELPGGGLEQGEDPILGLRREISEETGLNAEWISDEPVAFWTINKNMQTGPKWFAFVGFKMNISGTFKPSKSVEHEAEHTEAKYFSIEDALKLNLQANTRPFIEQLANSNTK